MNKEDTKFYIHMKMLTHSTLNDTQENRFRFFVLNSLHNYY